MEDVFSTNIERKFLALAKASFKVADLMPDIVFREKIKNQVLIVYEKFFKKNYPELLKETDILIHYFYLGGCFNLINEGHLKQLQNGFLVFKSQIIMANSDALKRPINYSEKNNENKKSLLMSDINNGGNKVSGENSALRLVENLNEKQKKIMEKFESKNILKLAEIAELFPDVSERTVRNELTSLINLGKITRSGNGNGSFYKKIIDS